MAGFPFPRVGHTTESKVHSVRVLSQVTSDVHLVWQDEHSGSNGWQGRMQAAPLQTPVLRLTESYRGCLTTGAMDALDAASPTIPLGTGDPQMTDVDLLHFQLQDWPGEWVTWKSPWRWRLIGPVPIP